ncbi:hypothetical protein JCM13304A_16930 [Desulfothermus okinawensis JCM 13304]
MSPLIDYSNIINLVQRELAKRYDLDKSIINVPGKSIACKVDENYYMMLHPSFIEYLCKLCGILPNSLTQTLIKTGNLIADPVTRDFYRLVEVRWTANMAPIKVKAGFVLSSLIDNSIRFYSKTIKKSLDVSDLKISLRSKSNIQSLFVNKTPLNSTVFFD